MKAFRMSVLVFIALCLIVVLMWKLDEHSKDVRMLEDANEQMRDVYERDYGVDLRKKR